jgi:nucleotide-binding universal stress UspA family protein
VRQTAQRLTCVNCASGAAVYDVFEPTFRRTTMFKHILVPTDGSSLSHGAAEQAVALAKLTGAQLTAFHVAPAYHFDLGEGPAHDFVPPNDYAARIAEEIQPHLEEVKELARAAGIACEARYTLSDFPAEAIVNAVEKYGCDAIVMGSHGRKGLNKLLLGSETEKVLMSTHVPVVVTH